MSEVLSRPIPIRIARFLLTEDWYACGTAIGNLMGYFPKIDDSGDEKADNRVHVLSDPNIEEGPPQPIQQLLYDVDGMITWDMAAKEDRGHPVYIPAGDHVKCYQPEDSADGHWEFLKAGEKCARIVVEPVERIVRTIERIILRATQQRRTCRHLHDVG